MGKIEDKINDAISAWKSIQSISDQKIQKAQSFSSSRRDYQYRRLENSRNIRLLDLQPGLEDDDLHANLREVRVDDDIKYQAVSYAWASVGDPTSLHIDASGRLTISKTLDLALRQFRLGNMTRSLWVDAICINQQNNEEKSTQVQMMTDIFRKAERVLVWLGHGDFRSDFVFDFMRWIDREIPSLIPQRYSNLEEFSKRWTTEKMEMWFADADQVATCLNPFLLRPWYRRVWIQQEVEVAQQIQVHCGSQVVSWKAFYSWAFALICHMWEGSTWIRSSGFRQIDGVCDLIVVLQEAREMTTGMKDSEDLLRRLEGCARCIATDPRDRLFALQTQVCEWTWLPKIDYSLSCVETYTRFAAACSDQGSLQILRDAGKAFQRFETLPSWVPDWTSSLKTNDLTSIKAASGYLSSCSRSVVDGANQLLIFDGLAFDVVREISGLLPTDLEGQDLYTLRASLELRCEELAASVERQAFDLEIADPIETLWRTLTGGLRWGDPRTPPVTWDQYRKWRFRRLQITATGESPSTQICGALSSLEQYLMQYMSIMTSSCGMFINKQLCITEKGYLGAVPDGVQPGDRVCIAFGCSCPLLLTKDDENGFATLRGPGFFDSLMRGEALDLCQRQSLNLKPLSPTWKRCVIAEMVRIFVFKAPDQSVKHSLRHPRLLTDQTPDLWNQVDMRTHQTSGQPRSPRKTLAHEAKSASGRCERWITDLGNYYIDRRKNIGTFDSPEALLILGEVALPEGWRVETRKFDYTYLRNVEDKIISWTDPRLRYLGPLPQGWALTFHIDEGTTLFFNKVNGTSTSEDPRLKGVAARKHGPLPEDWAADRDAETGALTFTYLPTGEATTDDPCLARDWYRPQFDGFVVK